MSNKRKIDDSNEEFDRRVSARLTSSSSNLTDKEIISGLRLEIKEKNETIVTLNTSVKSLSKLAIDLTNNKLNLNEINSDLKARNNSLEFELKKLSDYVLDINTKYATLLNSKIDLDHATSEYPHMLAIEIIKW